MSNDINETLGIQQTLPPHNSSNQFEKYAGLKNIAGIITVFAWIAGAVIIIMGIVTISNIPDRRYGGGPGGGQVALMMLLYLFLGAFIVVSLLAQSGIIRVLVDIEENTRKKD